MNPQQMYVACTDALGAFVRGAGFTDVVIGLSGGVANQGENLLKPLRAAVEPMVFGHDFAQKHTRITACTLGYRAGVIGAALLAKSRME